MKWIMLIGITFILSSCCCTNRVVQYRQVVVAPVVVEPVILGDLEPIDVTTTTIDFY